MSCKELAKLAGCFFHRQEAVINTHCSTTYAHKDTLLHNTRSTTHTAPQHTLIYTHYSTTYAHQDTLLHDILLQWQDRARSTLDHTPNPNFNYMQLSTNFSLAELMDGFEEWKATPKYRLRCMMCYYSSHFVLVAYKPRLREWALYDDSKVFALGDWVSVQEQMSMGGVIPLVLFYEMYA